MSGATYKKSSLFEIFFSLRSLMVGKINHVFKAIHIGYSDLFRRNSYAGYIYCAVYGGVGMGAFFSGLMFLGRTQTVVFPLLAIVGGLILPHIIPYIHGRKTSYNLQEMNSK